MSHKKVIDLQNELIHSPDLNLFLSENESNFNKISFTDLLNDLLQKKGLTKSALAKRAGISDVYLYQIFSGGRNPSRDRVLCLCVGLSATFEEAQCLLMHSGLAQLYVRDRRDAIITFGLTHGMDILAINGTLYGEHERTLC